MIDQSIEIQRTRFFESCLKLVEQSYSRLALLVIVKSLESSSEEKLTLLFLETSFCLKRTLRTHELDYF